MKFWSQYFVPTLKESPADAEIASHKLLVRAGLVRKLGGGLYTYMPLGLRVMQKLTQLCREDAPRSAFFLCGQRLRVHGGILAEGGVQGSAVRAARVH